MAPSQGLERLNVNPQLYLDLPIDSEVEDEDEVSILTRPSLIFIFVFVFDYADEGADEGDDEGAAEDAAEGDDEDAAHTAAAAGGGRARAPQDGARAGADRADGIRSGEFDSAWDSVLGLITGFASASASD